MSGFEMNRPRIKRFAVLTLAVALSACVSSDQLRKDIVEPTEQATKGPSTAPFRSVTNFSSAVRCMDSLLITFGTRDISVLVEDLEDATKKVSTGTKDMLLTTMSDMTRRSRAIKFVAYGGDSKNAVAFLAQAEKKDAYSQVPQFDIRGSVTQFDDNLTKATKDIGVGFGEFLTLGKSSSATVKLVALDLTVLNTSDFSLVPGVASKNAVALYSQGDGVDGEARYKKLGVNYSSSFSRNEGTAIAMRNLVELASVELIGKLTKVPYWKCLGAAPGDETVKTEVDDWFESMATNPMELFAYFQYQMTIRGAYEGPVDGKPTPALSRAI
jgi:curli biogenesis system outer membrane secretion channel CsgG